MLQTQSEIIQKFENLNCCVTSLWFEDAEDGDEDVIVEDEYDGDDDEEAIENEQQNVQDYNENEEEEEEVN